MTSSRGFTLVEILIGTAVLGLIGGILVTIMVNGSSLLSSENTKINHSLALTSVNSEFRSNIQGASSIASSYTSSSNQFNTSLSVIVFKIPSISGSGQIIAGKFDTVIFSPDPQKATYLKKYLFADATSSRSNEAKLLLNNLSRLQFYYLDLNGNQVTPTSASTIEYVINLSEKDNYSTKESSTSGRVNLKNI